MDPATPDTIARMTRRFVLVPGAGGNAQYWHRVEPLLRQAGHEVFAVDLPNWPGATLADQAQAIVSAGAGADEIVLVAQSMGAFSAPLTVDRSPVVELILLNPMIPDPGETAGDWWGNTGQDEARKAMDVREGRDPEAEFDLETYFLHDLPAEVADLLRSGEDEQPADSLFGVPFPLSAGRTCRRSVLSGREDRLLPIDFQRQVSLDRLGLEPEPLPGGHLLALSQPERLAERLLQARGPDGR